MTIQIGDKIPSVPLWRKTADGSEKTDFAAFCAGKTVALFAVPGAFTPTCQEQHFPGYKQSVAAFREKGVDAIACTSVNDGFVMGAWSEQLDPEGEIEMLADGNGELAKAMGLELDASGAGLGTRSRRYSMLIRDGVVEALHDEGGGGLEVSDAQTLLKDL